MFTALVVAVVVAAAGPELMQLAFGDRFDYDRPALLIVTAAMGLYLAATTVNQAVLAQGRARRAAGAWAICAVGFLVWSALPIARRRRAADRGRLRCSARWCCSSLLLRIYRDTREPRRACGPGSAEEIEARLALADEAS